MKKIIAILMALCLMLTAAAVAEEVEPRRVLQDEMPPALVAVDGVLARIVDAEGNVLAEITEEGALQMTDVHQRGADSTGRLNTAYEALMMGVHFSDVDSALERENLKEEINEKLAGHEDELTAYDVAMFEIFDIKVLGDIAALLADGAMIEITIKPEEMDIAPLLVGFSADGNEWHLLDSVVTNPDGTMTLRLPSEGTVSIMLEYEALYVPGSTYIEYTTEAYTGTKTIITPNDNFTPSVSGKPLPPIVTTVDVNGNRIIANIKMQDGHYEPIYSNDALVITPVSESAYVMDVTSHEHLQWSFDSILTAETVGHVRTGIGAEIDGVLKAGGYGLTHFDMVVRDLFEVSAYGDLVKHFYNDAELELQFDVELTDNAPLVVIFSSDSVNWHVLSSKNITLTEDGILTLRLPELGTVAFLTERADLLTNVSVKSPE